MLIQSMLTANNSKAQINKIIAEIGYDESQFEVLINLLLGDNELIARRAAWVFSEIAIHFPASSQRHWPALLACAGAPNAHDAIKRGIFRAFQFLEVPEKYLGETVQLCFEQLLNRQAAIAVRVFAMTSLVKLAQQLPELKSEISLILEDELPFGSAGFVSRAKRELKRL